MYDYIHSGNDERRDWCDASVRDQKMAAGMDRITGDYNEFWKQRDYLHDLAPVKAAVLMAHGLNDWNVVPEHGNRIYQALKSRSQNTQVFYHQGGHGGSPPKDMMNRWFARYLHGVENGVEKGPRAWIVREQDDRSKPTAYQDYPNPATKPVEFHLVAGAPEQGYLVASKQTGQGKETLVDNFSFSGSSLAQAQWTDHRLIYVTPELTEPIHLSGSPRISIRLASSKPAANLSLWLVSLPWLEKKKDAKITDNLITRGWADPQNHSSMTKGEPLVPGKFYEMTFDLQPDDQIIPAGQKIGLMIFSSDKDFTLWPTPGTKLTVDLDATSITLPVVGGRSTVAKAFPAKTASNPITQ
jgi:X-Pro dipeptidyl-peptidase